MVCSAQSAKNNHRSSASLMTQVIIVMHESCWEEVNGELAFPLENCTQ